MGFFKRSFSLRGFKSPYALLPGEVNSEEIHPNGSVERSAHAISLDPSRTHILLLYIACFILSAALFTVTAVFFHQTELHQISGSSATCGYTIQEAKASGCTFDHLTKTWLPSRCTRHGEPNFLKISASNNDTWPYWADERGIQALDIDEVALLAGTEGEWWTTVREHLSSCAWMTIRMAHAYTSGERVDGLAGQFHHVRHCTLLMLGHAWHSPAIDDIYTRLGGTKTGFGEC